MYNYQNYAMLSYVKNVIEKLYEHNFCAITIAAILTCVTVNGRENLVDPCESDSFINHSHKCHQIFVNVVANCEVIKEQNIIKYLVTFFK